MIALLVGRDERGKVGWLRVVLVGVDKQGLVQVRGEVGWFFGCLRLVLLDKI